MIELKKKEVEKLLKSIKHPEDRKLVKRYLQDLKNAKHSKNSEINRRGIAKQLANFLIQIGWKVGKHFMDGDHPDPFD